MSAPSFGDQIALGGAGWTPVIIQGTRTGFGASLLPLGDDLVWPLPLPGAGVACQIRCLDPADSAAGAGVQQVRITYLDAAGAVQTETLETSGTTAVPMASPLYRPLDLEAVRLGTDYDGAKDKILLETVSGGDILHTIGKGYTRSGSALYTVPAGSVGIIRQVVFGCKFRGASNTGELALWLTQDREGVRTPGVAHNVVPLRGESIDGPIPMPTPIRVAPLVDIFATCTRVSGGSLGDASVTIHMDLVPE